MSQQDNYISGADQTRHRYFMLPLLVSGTLSGIIIAASMIPTFAAMVASIQNTVNTAGTGFIAMQ